MNSEIIKARDDAQELGSKILALIVEYETRYRSALSVVGVTVNRLEKMNGRSEPYLVGVHIELPPAAYRSDAGPERMLGE